MDSDDLYDEAERLARAHPDYGYGDPDRHTSQWMPQHAVPRHKTRPPMSRIDLEYVERRVQADLDVIDRELDLIPTMDDLERTLTELQAYERDRTVVLNTPRTWPGVQDWFALNLQDAYSFTADAWITDQHDNVQIIDFKTSQDRTPGPGKQRKPKTYVALGRKQGKTWIARLNQSKEATNARNRNR